MSSQEKLEFFELGDKTSLICCDAATTETIKEILKELGYKFHAAETPERVISAPWTARASSPSRSFCGGTAPRSSNALILQSLTDAIASMMIGTLSGEGPWPGAERAWRPASPHSSMIRSLKPVTTVAF